MERAYGDHKHCTKLLQNAVNSVSDWPETLFDAYINYQREEGSLQDCVEAVGRCEAQQKRVEDRRTKAAGKESYSAHKHKKQGTFGKKGDKGHTPPDGSTGKSAGKWPSQAKVSFKRKTRQDPRSQTHQDPCSQTRQDPRSQVCQDPRSQACQDPRSQTRQDPRSQTCQDPRSQAHQDSRSQARQDPCRASRLKTTGER
ncbi:hypothetical protein LSAT2_006438 [Lamellibrachia satsuma]|nr:hypothetical protein LSAT2_006438 [Lamellibrachia satsuma]